MYRIFEAVVFVHGEPMRRSYTNFNSRLEAKAWCHANTDADDDSYVIFGDGLVIDAGIVDGMYEDDEEYMATL